MSYQIHFRVKIDFITRVAVMSKFGMASCIDSVLLILVGVGMVMLVVWTHWNIHVFVSMMVVIHVVRAFNARAFMIVLSHEIPLLLAISII